MRFSSIFVVFAAASFLGAAENSTAIDPAEQRIAASQKALQSNSTSPDPHIDLAAEYCRKARDSEQISYYSKAEAEREAALKLAPGNYDAQKLQVVILLGRSELSAALKLATELNRRVPDDIAMWGLLAQINTALGNYKEALRDAQWVLDIRPGSTLGFAEAARLREAYGDPEGAIEFYEEARQRTSFSDAEERAWLLSQIARLTVQTGDRKRAAALFDEALRLNPASQIAVAGLARLRALEGNYPEAIALYEKRYKAVQDARSLYDFAGALDHAGRKDEAVAAFRDFEEKAQAETLRPYNANIDLIHYYLDRNLNLAKALAIAERESAVRRDSQTLAALASALYANSRYDDARMRMDEALATGLRNPTYFCQAARIAAASNDSERAKTFLKDSLSLDTNGCQLETKQ